MWIFLAGLLVLSCFHTAINLSLFSKKREALYYCVFIAVIGCSMFPLSVRLSFSRWGLMVNDFNILSLVCTYQIAESVIFMILSFLLVRTYYKENDFWMAKIVPLLPSGLFFMGMFLAETYLFHTINDVNFVILTVLFSAVLAGGYLSVLLFCAA